MNVLVVAPAWIGDMVVAHSLVREVLRQDVTARVEMAAPAATFPLIARMPGVVGAHALPFGHGQLALLARRRVARSLAGHFDWAIVLPNSWKSALLPWFARVPRRTGYVGEHRYGLLNDIRRLDAACSPMLIQRYAALGQRSGPGSGQASDTAHAHDLLPPKLCVAAADTLAARARLRLVSDQPVLALCPGAEFGAAKRWPAAHFAAIAAAHLQKGFQVWMFGSRKDGAIANEIREGLGRNRTNLFDLTGKTSLPEAVDLLAAAARVVSNDSGLMHVAAALDVPVVGVFGSSSAQFTPPLGARASSVSLRLPCSPCFARTCRFGHYDCLHKLMPETVTDALDRLMERH